MISKRSNDSFRVTLPKNKDTYDHKYIYNRLNEYVIGQESAKKALAIAVSNYLIAFDYNINNRSNKAEDFVDRTNLLLVGHSGSGKTLLINTLEDIFPEITVYSIDVSSYTQAGYVGNDISSIINSAYEEKIKKTDSHSPSPIIIHVDEFDKISTSFTDGDVSTTGVQRELLKLVEGARSFNSRGKDRDKREGIKAAEGQDTRLILWVFTGAFSELVDKQKKRTKGTKVGFNDIKGSGSLDITSEDIIKYGILRELMGRIGYVVTLKEPVREDLRKILLNEKTSPITRYKKLQEIKGKSLQVDEGVVELLLDRAEKLGLGARGLKIACDEYFFNIMW